MTGEKSPRKESSSDLKLFSLSKDDEDKLDAKQKQRLLQLKKRYGIDDDEILTIQDLEDLEEIASLEEIADLRADEGIDRDDEYLEDEVERMVEDLQGENQPKEESKEIRRRFDYKLKYESNMNDLEMELDEHDRPKHEINTDFLKI